MGLSQSDTIFGALLIGFIVYITVRGQLPEYLDVFKHAPREQHSGGGGSNAIVDKGANLLENFAQDTIDNALSSFFGT